MIKKEDEQAGWKIWEEDQRTNPTAVNPHAFVYGYAVACKIMRDKKEEGINAMIKEPGINTNLISDGYHTFKELYDHRVQLFIALCKTSLKLEGELMRGTSWISSVWRSKLHCDGSGIEGWFIMGIFMRPGKQITYHLPMSKWDDCNGIPTYKTAPEWDGHTSADVLERLSNLSKKP
jgi:hypothetical protein